MACEGISLLPTGIQWLYLALTCAGADGSQCLRYKQSYVFKPAHIQGKIMKAKQVADLISQATHVNHRDDIIALVNEVFESIYDGDYVCGNHAGGNSGGGGYNDGDNNWGDFNGGGHNDSDNNGGGNNWVGAYNGWDDYIDIDDDKKNLKGKKNGKKDKSNRNKAVTNIDKSKSNKYDVDDDDDFNYLTLDRDFHNSFNTDLNNNNYQVNNNSNNNYQGINSNNHYQGINNYYFQGNNNNNYQGNDISQGNNSNTGIMYDYRGDEIPLIIQQFNRESNVNSNIFDILQITNQHLPLPQQQHQRPPPPPPRRNQNNEKETKNGEKQKETKRLKREKKDLKPSQVVKKMGKKCCIMVMNTV